MVPQDRRYYIWLFKTYRRVTLREPVYPTILNIVFNAVVQSALVQLYYPQESHHGMGWLMGEQHILFYSNDACITGRNPIRVQDMLATLVWMFEQVGMYKNLGKTKTKTCTPGFIWGGARQGHKQVAGDGRGRHILGA